jgi:hypothetical protein
MKRIKLNYVIVIKSSTTSSKRTYVFNGTFSQVSKKASELCYFDEYIYSITVA